jgi:Glu-tRNA(Gln) amidotransferase subunit E-like FAD-binding protein
MKKCPICGRPVDAEITILRRTGTELAYAHHNADGAVDMCHSDELDLPRPYVYDEATQTVYGVSATKDDREAV